MKFPLPERPFAPLELSEEFKESLSVLADQKLQATLEEYEGFINGQNGKVDLSKWKYVRKKHDITIYQSRDKINGKPAQPASLEQSEGASSLHQAELDTVDAQTLLWYGTMVGNLNDVMYGVVAPSVELMELKSTYVPDNFVDRMVLMKIIEATPDDPFRGLFLKWGLGVGPKFVRSFVRPRDSAYLEATGITTTGSGERIGYHFFHTLTIPGVRVLHEFKVVRCAMSAFHLFRQKASGVVEVYVKSVVNLMGNIPPSVVVLSIGDAVASLTEVPIVAEIKKLNWLINTSNNSTDSNQSCCGCQRDLNRHRSTPCAICNKHVCRRCQVVKKISFVDKESGKVVQRKMAFCGPCMQKALKTDSLTIATEEISKSQQSE